MTPTMLRYHAFFPVVPPNRYDTLFDGDPGVRRRFASDHQRLKRDEAATAAVTATPSMRSRRMIGWPTPSRHILQRFLPSSVRDSGAIDSTKEVSSCPAICQRSRLTRGQEVNSKDRPFVTRDNALCGGVGRFRGGVCRALRDCSICAAAR